MYHSITFKKSESDSKNTWADWGLVPTELPRFTSPEVRTNTLNLSGMNGILDLTDYLIGYPLYNNRSGTFNFLLNSAKLVQTVDFYSDPIHYKKLLREDIMRFLHGKQCQAILEDDSQYCYEGRWSVGDWSMDNGQLKIPISYSVSPYKIRTYETSLSFDDISASPVDISEHVESKPVYPIIHADKATKLTYLNEELYEKTQNNKRYSKTIDIKAGDNVCYDVIFSNISGVNRVTLQTSTPTALTIKFRNGKL